MVCTACGTDVASGVNFCPRCGASIAAVQQPPFYPPPPPVYGMSYMPRPRVAQNLQSLGILWWVYAAYRAIGGLIGIFVLHMVSMRHFGGGWPFGHDFYDGWGQGTGWIAALAPVIAVYTVLSVALAVFTGYSLLNRKPWGRTLAIVAGVLALFKPLMGTALGIYTLYVLAPSMSGAEYDAIAEQS